MDLCKRSKRPCIRKGIFMKFLYLIDIFEGSGGVANGLLMVEKTT